MYDLKTILKILPQRYPFLFIDKLVEFERNTVLKVLKNLTVTEEIFNGHFPKRPVMPGVLILEAMGQAGIIFLTLNNTDNLDNIKKAEAYYLCSVKARFLKVAIPGDSLHITIRPIKLTSKMGIVKATAFVDEIEIARAELTGVKDDTNYE